MASRFFSAHAQIVVGLGTFVVGLLAWVLGTFVIPGAAALPWDWQPVAFVFHISMFYGQVACYSIISNGIGIRKTEHVETKVANIDHAEEVEVG